MVFNWSTRATIGTQIYCTPLHLLSNYCSDCMECNRINWHQVRLNRSANESIVKILKSPFNQRQRSSSCIRPAFKRHFQFQYLAVAFLSSHKRIYSSNVRSLLFCLFFFSKLGNRITMEFGSNDLRDIVDNEVHSIWCCDDRYWFLWPIRKHEIWNLNHFRCVAGHVRLTETHFFVELTEMPTFQMATKFVVWIIKLN